MDNKKKRLETGLIYLLREGKQIKAEPQEEALKNLIPPYESRVQAEKDPIKEETKIVQKYIKETNKKYLDYLKD